MRRVVLRAWPERAPQAVVLIDVAGHEITSFMGDEISEVRRALRDYDHVAAVDVRALLRRLEFEPGERRLGELGPPQKTRQLDRRGRTLRITTRLLVQGSCGIGRPFGEDDVLRRYLRSGENMKLRRRLEADAKALFALYRYGRLHGAVRLRWGFLDEWIPAPWVHPDEPTLRDLMAQAQADGVPLEVVVGNAPSWAEPWGRARRAVVCTDDHAWRSWLVDENGDVLDAGDIQLARLAPRRAFAP